MLSRVASWHQGSSVSSIGTPMRARSSSRPRSVIFGNRRESWAVMASPARLSIGGVLAFAQRLAVDLAGRRLGQLGDERDLARIFVLAEAQAGEILQLAG